MSFLLYSRCILFEVWTDSRKITTNCLSRCLTPVIHCSTWNKILNRQSVHSAGSTWITQCARIQRLFNFPFNGLIWANKQIHAVPEEKITSALGSPTRCPWPQTACAILFCLHSCVSLTVLVLLAIANPVYLSQDIPTFLYDFIINSLKCPDLQWVHKYICHIPCSKWEGEAVSTLNCQYNSLEHGGRSLLLMFHFKRRFGYETVNINSITSS